MAADGNLLLGLLVLQNGIINQGQLVAAFQAWTLDKSKNLADHLEERGELSGARRTLLEALAEVHLEAHGGDIEKSLAAVSAGKSTRESLTRLGDPDIDATLAHVPSAHGSTENGDADRTASYAVGTATSDGQRFRVLRPHARGGLGAVFVALDAELNREVALKQILDHHADDATSRQRFLLEAEVTGGLEHPGIVPVYGLGSYADGRPYYAMRFIRGDSLAKAIGAFHADETLKTDRSRRSLELRKLLLRFTDVCNAIEYAHSRGVLHRDIKPGNIIVGKHGETLVVDWGLAKATGKAEPGAEERTLMPSSASGSAETLLGSALGTPAYMSPEQARGEIEHLGPRSDVYSLGATLYCLLTGKPPQEGDDLGAILRRVQRGEFIPPRQRDPAIDQALEAICLKAMALQPEDRYASGRALADDIERWMADEPVAAYPEPWTRTLMRWLARHRTGVTAAGAAVLAALIGLGAVLGVQRQSNAALAARNRDLDQANVRLREAIAQKEQANTVLGEANTRVQARFDLAREAIRSFKAGVEEEETLKENRLRPLRDKLLGSARRFYDKLCDLLRGQEDGASKAILAESYAELGELIDRIGQKPEAMEAFKKAVAIRRDLAGRPGAGAAETIALAKALNGLGEESQNLGDLSGTLALLGEAIALVEPIATGPGAPIEARRALGTARQVAGASLQATGKLTEAMVASRQAIVVWEPLCGDASAVPEDRRNLAVSHALMGDLLEKTGNLAGALAEQRKFQELMRALAAEHPDVPDYPRNLAVSHNLVGRLLEITGDLPAALTEQRKYQELMRALVAEHPEVPDYRRNLAVSHAWLGSLLEKTGDLAAALAEQRKYQELMRALVTEHAEVPDYRRSLAVSHYRVSNLLLLSGKPGEALAEIKQARELGEALCQNAPNVPKYRDELVAYLNNGGAALRDLKRPSEARDRHSRAVTLAEGLAAASPKVPLYRSRLADSLRRLADLELSTGDTTRASAAARRAIALFEGLPAREGGQWFQLACARATLAAAGEPRQADQAMDDLRQAVAMGYRNPAQYRYEPALGPLRGRADFKLLMMDLAFPSDPFGR